MAVLCADKTGTLTYNERTVGAVRAMPQKTRSKIPMMMYIFAAAVVLGYSQK
jgi:magnesium-transporting ATPase (P-type)